MDSNLPGDCYKLPFLICEDCLRNYGGKTGLENTAKYTNYPLNYL